MTSFNGKLSLKSWQKFTLALLPKKAWHLFWVFKKSDIRSLSWFWHESGIGRYLKDGWCGPDSGLHTFGWWHPPFDLCGVGTRQAMLQIVNWDDSGRLSRRHLQQIIQWKFSWFVLASYLLVFDRESFHSRSKTIKTGISKVCAQFLILRP